MIETFKIKYDLAPPIIDSMLNRRNICYNFRNLQYFQLERKKTVLWFRNYSLPRTPIIDNFAGGFKQRNTISLFESESDVRQWICNKCPCRLCKVFVPNLGFIWDTAPNLVFNIYHGLFNAYIYTSRLAGRYMSNWEFRNILVFVVIWHVSPCIYSFYEFKFFHFIRFFVVDIN